MAKIKQMSILIEQFKKTPIIQIACGKSGVSRATYYRWKKEDPEFACEADEAILEGKKLINDMAESQLISAIQDRNLTAIIFWLKNHHKDYKDRIELSGEITAKGKITPEQEEAIVKALSLALFTNPPTSLTQNKNE